MEIKLDVKSVEHHELLETQEQDTDEIYNDENDSTVMADTQEEIYTEDECTEMLSEIDQLKDAKVIEVQLHEKIHQNLNFYQIKSETIPMYVQDERIIDNSSNKKRSLKTFHLG